MALSQQSGSCGGEADAFRDLPRRRRGSSGGIPLLRNPLRAARDSRRSRRSCSTTLIQSITTPTVAPITHTAIGAKNAICSSEYFVTAAPINQIASTATITPARSRWSFTSAG